jgi:hypothetical protein
MTPLRAVIVCVDYADLLAVTLAYNRHHFSEALIVTSPNDQATMRVSQENRAAYYTTNAFYADGAVFNKFRALEEGLDVFGRHGWLCIMDADVLWPKHIDWHFTLTPNPKNIFDRDKWLTPECLYTPRRRMCEDLSAGIPHEPYWQSYPLHPQQTEWAGYTQIFHAEDTHLPEAPWHQTNWRHAGGADSFFQQLWPKENKIRPPFECLHLGPAGRNWCGRSTPYLDGTVDPKAGERISSLRNFMSQRTRTKSFDSEKL